VALFEQGGKDLSDETSFSVKIKKNGQRGGNLAKRGKNQEQTR